MNILTVMRKSRLSKSVSACKLNLFNENNSSIKSTKDDINELPCNKDLKSAYESNVNSLNDATRQNSIKEELPIYNVCLRATPNYTNNQL